MICDIVMPVFNRPDLTKGCIDSIYKNTPTPFRLIVIDNGSGPETKEYLESVKSGKDNITVIKNTDNIGWVKAVNQGMGVSRSPYVLIMNNDTLVKTRDWLSALICVAESDARIGLVNPAFCIKKGDPARLPFIEVDFCRGYCVLIKRAVMESIGGLDEAYGIGYYDDDDYSVRAINAGFLCVRAGGILVEHLGDATFRDIYRERARSELHERNKRLFYSKWGRRLRLVFIVTGSANRDSVKNILLVAARRQHIVYLWNSGEPFNINHINVRERRLFAPMLSLDIMLNRFKKPDKHYDAIFKDNLNDNLIGKIDFLSKRNTQYA